MSTTLTTNPAEQGRLQAGLGLDSAPTGTVGALDRIAMRAGLALILWSRHHVAAHVQRDRIDAAAADRDRHVARIDRPQRPLV